MYCLVYITNPDRAVAETVATLLLEHKLIACANIYDGVQSLYFWQGKFERNSEVILIGKTRQNLFAQIYDLIKNHHPYQTPCILSLPISEGNADYLQWIEDSLV